jgi:hypothetical protein
MLANCPPTCPDHLHALLVLRLPGGVVKAKRRRCLCSTRMRQKQTAATTGPCSSSGQPARGSYPSLRRTVSWQQRQQGQGRQGSLAGMVWTRTAAAACSSQHPPRATCECYNCPGGWRGGGQQQQDGTCRQGDNTGQGDCPLLSRWVVASDWWQQQQLSILTLPVCAVTHMGVAC